MRRVTLISLMLVLLAACGVTDQSTSAPSLVSQSAQTSAYPTPVAATAAPTSAPPTATSVPTVVASATPTPVPTRRPNNPPPQPVDTAPFRVVETQKRPTQFYSSAIIGLSHDATTLLVQANGVTQTLIVEIAVATGDSTIVVDTPAPKATIDRVRATWDQETDTLTYAEYHDDGTFDIATLDRQKKIKKILKSKVKATTADLNQRGVLSIIDGNDLVQDHATRGSKRMKLPQQATSLLNNSAKNPHFWFASDSTHFALAYEHDLYIFAVGQDAPLQHYEFQEGIIHDVVWSPDSTALYFARWSSDLPHKHYGKFVQKITETKPQVLGRGKYIPNVSNIVDGITWSADSQWLLVGYTSGRQCAPKNCIQHLVLINPFISQGTIVLAEPFGISGEAILSDDLKTIVQPCLDLVSGSPSKPEQFSASLCILTIAENK